MGKRGHTLFSNKWVRGCIPYFLPEMLIEPTIHKWVRGDIPYFLPKMLIEPTIHKWVRGGIPYFLPKMLVEPTIYKWIVADGGHRKPVTSQVHRTIVAEYR